MAKQKFIFGAIIGAVAGVIAGVLTAPKSGKETRADLRQKAVDIKQNVSDKTEDVLEKSGDFANDMKERVDRSIEGAKKGFTDKE
jgi:gas vesicle protein